METPYPVSRDSDQLHYTYLDTFGRPVLVATKSNLVEQHIQDMVVSCGYWVCGGGIYLLTKSSSHPGMVQFIYLFQSLAGSV